MFEMLNEPVCFITNSLSCDNNTTQSLTKQKREIG